MRKLLVLVSGLASLCFWSATCGACASTTNSYTFYCQPCGGYDIVQIPVEGEFGANVAYNPIACCNSSVADYYLTNECGIVKLNHPGYDEQLAEPVMAS